MDSSTNFGRLYTEIVNGFSTKEINKKKFYFKHPSIAEHFSIYNNYELLLESSKKRGLPTEKEKIQEAIDGGWWSGAKESEIAILRKTISNLNKTKNKLVLPSQKKSIEIQIKKNEAILLTFLKERKEITNLTAEEYASERFIDEMIILLTYKDPELNIKYFNNNDFYDLSDRECEEVKNSFTNSTNIFNNYNIKCIAASGFFQNIVYLNEDAYSFWGKAATKCTKYQIDLLVYGKMYKNLIKSYNEQDKSVPDDIMEDPEKFVSWVDNLKNSSGKQSKTKKNDKLSNSKNKVSSFVGATKEDLDQLGVKTEKIKGKNLLELAEESGGVLEKHQYLKARESS